MQNLRFWSLPSDVGDDFVDGARVASAAITLPQTSRDGLSTRRAREPTTPCPYRAIPGRPKTAFVFAGGGSFGAIQVGMLHALAKHGVTADMVVGSSVGALNGAYYAGDPTLKGILQLETIWRGLHRQDVFPITWRTLARLSLAA